MTFFFCKHHVLPFFLGPEPMDITSSSPPSPVEVPSSDVTILGGHTSEV